MKRKYFSALWDAWEAPMEQKKVIWKLRIRKISRLLIVTGLEEPLEYLRSVEFNTHQWVACHLFGPFFWVVEDADN